MKLAIFDFDGTITEKDSVIQFAKFTYPKNKFWLKFILIAPVLLGRKLRLISSHKLLELFLRLYFKGWGKDPLEKAGKDFAYKKLPGIINHSARDRIKWHQVEGHKIVIATASCPEWIKPWAEKLNIDLIASELEYEDGRFTGILKGGHCSGEGKKRRILQALDLDKYEYIYAYGDQPSDRPMLELAHAKYYRRFD